MHVEACTDRRKNVKCPYTTERKAKNTSKRHRLTIWLKTQQQYLPRKLSWCSCFEIGNIAPHIKWRLRSCLVPSSHFEQLGKEESVLQTFNILRHFWYYLFLQLSKRTANFQPSCKRLFFTNRSIQMYCDGFNFWTPWIYSIADFWLSLHSVNLNRVDINALLST